MNCFCGGLRNIEAVFRVTVPSPAFGDIRTAYTSVRCSNEITMKFELLSVVGRGVPVLSVGGDDVVAAAAWVLGGGRATTCIVFPSTSSDKLTLIRFQAIIASKRLSL